MGCDTMSEGPPVIVRLWEGVYLPPGGGFSVAVDDAEDDVLTAFIERPAMRLPALVDATGHEHAHKILARLTWKYDGRFAPAIRLPGGKGRGGYSVLIREDAPPSTKRPATPVSRGRQ
jgi:hypothetical protein